jgi:hypothetical protein
MNNSSSSLKNKITDLPNIVKENFNNAAQVVDNGYNQIKTSFNNGLSGFNQQSNVGMFSTQDFLSSNTIVAKFAFVILVIILFIFLLSLGIRFMSYVSAPINNPFISPGITEGNSYKTVYVNPGVSGSIPILRSNNEKTGLEFSWSVWLLVKGVGTTNQNVFNKGTKIQFNNNTATPTPTSNDSNDIADVNCPGLYITPNSELLVVVDSTDGSNTQIVIPNIPLNKWLHIVVRAENTILDVYVNGTIAERVISSAVPKQNFYDIQISQNNGFQGQMSNLQYFNSALSVIQINNLMFWGPNLSQVNPSSNYNNNDYLSPAWYNTGSVHNANNSYVANSVPQI